MGVSGDMSRLARSQRQHRAVAAPFWGGALHGDRAPLGIVQALGRYAQMGRPATPDLDECRDELVARWRGRINQSRAHVIRRAVVDIVVRRELVRHLVAAELGRWAA